MLGEQLAFHGEDSPLLQEKDGQRTWGSPPGGAVGGSSMSPSAPVCIFLMKLAENEESGAESVGNLRLERKEREPWETGVTPLGNTVETSGCAEPSPGTRWP